MKSPFSIGYSQIKNNFRGERIFGYLLNVIYSSFTFNSFDTFMFYLMIFLNFCLPFFVMIAFTDFNRFFLSITLLLRLQALIVNVKQVF